MRHRSRLHLVASSVGERRSSEVGRPHLALYSPAHLLRESVGSGEVALEVHGLVVLSVQVLSVDKILLQTELLQLLP